MALNINESTSSLADFMSKLYAFATTAGAGNPDWSADRDPGANPGEFAVSRAAIQSNTNDVQVAMGWDTGTPSNVAVYQYDHASGAGNYNAGRAGPWDQDNDSGNGFAGTANASIAAWRHVTIGNAPVQYWAFAGRSTHSYLHVVVQISSTQFVHFGWGELDKFNDWQGGAYAYGYFFGEATASNQTIQVISTQLLDGLLADGASVDRERFAATINCESLPAQPAGGKWAVVMGNQTDLGTDRQSNGGGSDTARSLFIGGYRANEIARGFGGLPVSSAAGFVPAYPIMTWYWDRSSGSVVYGPMGVMPDVRGVNMDQFTPGEERVIGSDTWVIFPSRYKGTSGSETGSSKNQGIMYLKNP